MVVDIILFAVLAIAIFIGWKRGLVLSIFLLGSTIISIILASLLSPVVSAGLDKLGVADAMAPKFSSYVEEAMLKEYSQTGAMDVEAAADSLPLPSFLSDKVAENINDSAADSIESIAGKIGAEAADMVCTVISFAIVFVLVMILMQVIKKLLKIVVRLPIVNKVDKIGGLAIGLVQGLLFVLVVLLLVSALSSASFMQGPVEAIEGSTLTRFLYEGNFIGKIIAALI